MEIWLLILFSVCSRKWTFIALCTCFNNLTKSTACNFIIIRSVLKKVLPRMTMCMSAKNRFNELLHSCLSVYSSQDPPETKINIYTAPGTCRGMGGDVKWGQCKKKIYIYRFKGYIIYFCEKSFMVIKPAFIWSKFSYTLKYILCHSDSLSILDTFFRIHWLIISTKKHSIYFKYNFCNNIRWKAWGQ